MSDEKETLTSSTSFRVITKIAYGAQFIRAILHIYLFLTSPLKSVIEKDINRWIELIGNELYQQGLSSWKGLVWLLWREEAYRNLFYYRIKLEYRLFSRIILEVAKLIYSPRNTLFIKAGSIGEGFFIQHGYATGISARSIGDRKSVV